MSMSTRAPPAAKSGRGARWFVPRGWPYQSRTGIFTKPEVASNLDSGWGVEVSLTSEKRDLEHTHHCPPARSGDAGGRPPVPHQSSGGPVVLFAEPTPSRVRSGDEADPGRLLVECVLLGRGEWAAVDAGGGELWGADGADFDEVAVAGGAVVRKNFQCHAGPVSRTADV